MFNKLASENTLVRAQFGRTLEGDVACLGGAPSFLGSYANQRALELRDAEPVNDIETAAVGIY